MSYVNNLWSTSIGFIVFLCVTLFIVTIHELGHYLVGKYINIKIREFSVGIGAVNFLPKFIDKSKTIWRIGLFPIGGYVSFVDKLEEMEIKSESDDENLIIKSIKSLTPGFIKRFLSKINRIIKSAWDLIADNTEIDENKIPGKYINNITPLEKIALASAGPIANFLLSIAILTSLYTSMGRDFNTYILTENTSNNLRIGDAILWVDDDIVPLDKDQMKFYLRRAKNLAIRRGDEVFRVENNKTNFEFRVESVKTKLSLIDSFVYTINDLWITTKTSVIQLGLAIFGGLTGSTDPRPRLSGPIGIFKRTIMQVRAGVYPLLYWTAILSLSLGIMNLLFIPPFDGSVILLGVFELFFGKNKKMEDWFNEIALFVVLFFIIMTTRSDLFTKKVVQEVASEAK